MSLVSKSQQPGFGNGSQLTNGVAPNGRPTALGEGLNFPQNNGPQLEASFDLWGMLQRRKYVIALFCIIGAGLGYLNFINSPKSYSSFTRLLITTQAPPSIVNGNVMVKQSNSIPNHTSLLVSELVLGNAVERGNLENYKTFSKNGDPVGTLKGMLRVAPETGDTLRVTCIGPQPDELPGIVNQVINSYRRVIAEDSQTGSEQAVELIESLAGKLSDEKAGLLNDRLVLWKELDISSMSEEGLVRNPHARKLSELRTYKDELELQLSDIRLRAKQLSNSLSKKEDTDAVDPLEIKIAAIEARDYLKIAHTNLNRRSEVDEETRQWQSLQRRAWDVETAISELQAQKLSRSSMLGEGHRDIINIDKQIKYRKRESAKLLEEMSEIQVTVQSNEKENQGNEQVLAEKLLEGENKNLIKMYFMSLKKQDQTLGTKLARVQEDILDVSKRAANIGEKIVQLNVIQKTIDKKEQAVDVILDRIKEMNVLADNYTMTKIRVLDDAKHGYKIAPSMPKCLATGTMLAALAGIALAYLIDLSDMAYRSPAEILSAIQLPVVGKIPRIRTKRIQHEIGIPELVTAHNPSASESEAFRELRTGLFFRSFREDIKTILFTSPSPGDGKSTTAANLAICIAQAGKKVILVDADFRRPRVDNYFGVEIGPGMLDVILGEAGLDEAIQPTQLQTGLSLLTTGGHPKNPGELVTSVAFREVLEELRETYDYVIIDSPPVLAVSDSATIASLVDGVYLVSRIRKGVKLTARKAKDSLDVVQAKWLGLIVNDVDQNPHYHEYGYQYGSYYYGSYGYRTYYETDKRIATTTTTPK